MGGLIIGVGEKLFEFLIGPMVGGATENWFAYVLALLFLVFDVEAVFIFPWAVSTEHFKSIGNGALVFFEMVAFVMILFLGLIYAIRKGVLRWE